MPKISVLDIQKFQILPRKHAPGHPTLLCTKRQFYPTKMQKKIKAYQIERFKDKLTNHVFHFFSLFPLSFFLFLFFLGGVISINLGHKGGGAPQKMKTILMKRWVIIYYRSYPSNPTSPPPPLKMNGN